MKKTLPAHLSMLNTPETRCVEESVKLLNAGFSEEDAKILIDDDDTSLDWELFDCLLTLDKEASDIADPSCVEPSETRCTGKRGNPLFQDSSAADDSITLSEGYNSLLKRPRNKDAEPFDPMSPEISTYGLISPEMRHMRKTLSRHLSRLNISEPRYENERLKLLNAGFSEEEVLILILRKYSSRAVAAVLEYSEILSAAPYFLTKAQIVQIAAHGCGSKNIKALLTLFEALQAMGFSVDQMVKMCAHNSGSLKLQAVIDYYPRLQRYGYTTDTMVALVLRSRSLNEIKKQAEMCLAHELPEKSLDTSLDWELFDWLLTLDEEASDIADPSCVEPSEIRLLKRSRNEDPEPSDSMSLETSTCGLILSGMERRLTFFSAAPALDEDEEEDFWLSK